MGIDLIRTIAELRLAIGYLGERDQFGWWQSSFFTRGSDAFLSPLFGRTQLLAQCNGVTRAASIIHDERIGVGKVYHLFRLPEDIEMNIYNTFQNMREPLMVFRTGNVMSFLKEFALQPGQVSSGPTRVGDTKSIFELYSWKVVSGLYLNAIDNKVETFPYFSEI